MEFDFAWIESCDCLLRLPGESIGADREDVYARSIGIQVFHSVDELTNYYKN